MREAFPDGADASFSTDGASLGHEPIVDENGVDLTLVRYTLSLTPSQRLHAIENFMNALSTVRRPERDSK